MSNQTRDDAVRAQTLGFRAEKTLVCTVSLVDIFTVYGRNMITLLYGQVTVAEATGASTILLETITGTLDMCAATTVTADAIGTMYFLTGEKAVILNGTGHVPIIDVATNITLFPSSPVFVGRTDTEDGIQLVETGNSAELTIKWSVFYIPLEEGAYIIAA